MESQDIWENDSTLTAVRVFWGAAPFDGAVVTGDRRAGVAWIDVDRSHGAVWNWTHKLSESQNDPATAEPSRVVVDEKRIELHNFDDIEFLVDSMAPLLNIV
jgi:hypothetical protein